MKAKYTLFSFRSQHLPYTFVLSSIILMTIFLFSDLNTFAFSSKKTNCDLVVSGATPAGICAAVAASRSGLKVVIVESERHVGGIIAAGLTNADIITRKAIGGLFNEYQQRIHDYYLTRYGANSEQVKICKGGMNVEPSVAEQIFETMLKEASVEVLKGWRIVDALVESDGQKEVSAQPGRRFDEAGPKSFPSVKKLRAVVIRKIENTDEETPGQLAFPKRPLNKSKKIERTLRAPNFIDATYEGDLAALAGADYRVGRESRNTFNERLAGNILVPFGTLDIHPDSTGKGDRGIQAFCFRFYVTDDPRMKTPFVKPETYNREDYRPLLNDFKERNLHNIHDAIQFFPMPNGKYETNSNHPHPKTGVPSESFDLAEENWNWPEAGHKERAAIFKRYWNYSEGLIWFLQNDPEVPYSIRKAVQKFGLCTREFTDNKYRPHLIYVRQGRRIWGEYNFTENDTNPDPKTGSPARKSDAIALAEFPLDSHGVTKFNPKWPKIREGYFYIAHKPAQIPFRICIPKSVDCLLVPVACSTSHVGYQTIRVEPTFMAIGEACGIAVAESVRQKKSFRSIDIEAVQKEILKRNGVLQYGK